MSDHSHAVIKALRASGIMTSAMVTPRPLGYAARCRRPHVRQEAASDGIGISVMNMCPGACVIINGGLAAIATA